MSSNSDTDDITSDDPRSSSPPKREDYGSYGENSSPLSYYAVDSDSDQQQSDDTQSDSTASPSSSPVKRRRAEESLDEISQDPQHQPCASTSSQDCQQQQAPSVQADQLMNVSSDSDTESESSSHSDNVSVSRQRDHSSPSEDSEASGDSYQCDEDDGSEPLFVGSSKTTDEAVLEVCKLFLKHRWTKASLNDTLKYMSSTLPADNNMPESLYMLCKYVNAASASCPEEPHFYCSDCFQVKADRADVCGQCEKDQTGAFYTFSFEAQIKAMFEQNNLAEAIDSYKEIRSKIDKREKLLCDVLDGTEYERVKEEATGPYDLIMMWATDGVALSDSSNVKLYPVVFQICEVAPRLRSSFTMVNCVWVDEKAPNFNTLFQVLAQELNDINSRGGVEWKHPKTGETFKSRLFAPLLIGDAPVRGDALNLMRYNCIRGCEKCEQKAKKLRRRQGDTRSVRRFVFQETPATQRTPERMRLQSNYAETENLVHCKGVKAGIAAIELMPLLRRSTCTVAEYMHSALLGVTLYFTHKFFSKAGGPWYIGREKKNVDKFLTTSVKVLDFMRDCRKISDISHFKASEWRAWLLFYSPVVLANPNFHFPDVYYQHWLLFVKSMYILLSDEITESALSSADVMLRCFLRDIGKLYSDYDYLYNVHQLSHFTTYVREWGPLPFTSAFPFENYYGVLSRMVHGTKHQGKELTENIKLSHCIHVLEQKVENSRGEKIVVSEIPRGKADGIRLDNEDLEVLQRENIAEFQTFRRAVYKNVAYTCNAYDDNKKKCNSLIAFLHEGSRCFGEIVCFVSTADSTLCLVDKLKVRQEKILFHRESMQRIGHLLPVRNSGVKMLVPFSAITSKVFRVGEYIALLPNKFERSL